ncbi:MAG TPA: M3 family metallopeptidase [Candidatus Sphingobacterium stercoripullorum]|nr:M3 family metallopeptidase [Candidatus Sphingobacterium stercoripullorum]
MELLATLNTKYGSIPFSKINESDYKPAFKQAIDLVQKEVQDIIDLKDAPTFKNTIEALEYSGMPLERISNIFFNLQAADTNENIDAIAQEVAPWLSELSNDIILNQSLFERIKLVYENRAEYDLNPEEKTLLEHTYKSFIRNGALLNSDEKKTLRAIDKELSTATLKFSENVLADTNAYELHLTDPEDLKGLPSSIQEAAKELAKEQGKEGWIFTLHYPSYVPFVTYADNRRLREKMSLAYGKRGFQNNKNNNESLVKKIASLRHQRAVLLGYDSHAHFVLEERMAKSPEAVYSFLENLRDKSYQAATKELQELQEFSGSDFKLQKWDSAYYAEKLKHEKLDFNDELLKPYFELHAVVQGAFSLAEELFAIKFIETDELDTYHPEVKTYTVEDAKGNHLGLFYADFFPRPGKRNGAWMTQYQAQYRLNGEHIRPHVAIVCNFSRPTATIPSLLTFQEVTTLFHEFGHALHGLLANTTYPGMSGTSVYWDFVELPSQLMENWCYEEEMLARFAKHYQTGETLPKKFIDKIKLSRQFLEAMATVRQLGFSFLDMAWHSQDPRAVTDLKKFENEQFKTTQLFDDVPENAMSTSFSHLFEGGYAAGYYSYKWSEVLDADAFSYFKEKGLFNKDIAKKLQDNILSKGGTEDPEILYERFRGRKAKLEALLERAGFKSVQG